MDKTRKIGFLSDLEDDTGEVKVIMSPRDFYEYRMIMAQVESQRDANGELPIQEATPEEIKRQARSCAPSMMEFMRALAFGFYVTYPRAHAFMYAPQMSSVVAPLTALIAQLT